MLLVKKVKLMSGVVVPAIAVKINSIMVSQDQTVKDRIVDKKNIDKFVCSANLDMFEYNLTDGTIGDYIDIGLNNIVFNYDINTKENTIAYGYSKLKEVPLLSKGTLV